MNFLGRQIQAGVFLPLDKSISEDPTIYPPADVDAKLFTFAVLPPEVDRQYTRIWTELKTGR
ncbi:MAG: hypothetical protein DI537_49220, partial [Stutzerimonas stutzeri]